MTEDNSIVQVYNPRVLKAPPFKRRSLPEEYLPEEYSHSAPPKVCSVHPGRALELSTAIGLAHFSRRSNEGLIDSTSHFNQAIPFSGGNLFSQHRGQLKSGRLQPLGLHSIPQLSSEVCLGIISVKPRRSSLQHHRSLTAPAIRPGSRDYGYLRQGHTKSRRSYSAAVSSSPLSLISMIPTRNQPLPLSLSETHPLLPPVSLPNRTAVDSRRGGRMRIEIKGRGNEITSPIAITTKDIPIEVTTNSPSPPQPIAIENYLTTPLEINLTASKSKGRKSSGLQGRRAAGRGGKLSYGWTASQPIEPLVGSLPPLTDSKQVKDKRREAATSNGSVDQLDLDTAELMLST